MPDTLSTRRLLFLLAGIWLLLNASILLGGRVLPWDALDQFYPTVYFNAHSLRSGVAPWWNPYIYGGYAQIGDPQGMLFSPLLMAWMLLPADPGANWFAWGVLLHTLMGGAAMLQLMRRHGANGFGALVGAVVFMAGGVAGSRLQHTPIIIAYAYVPVVLLALRHLLARPTPGRGLLLGLAAGAMVTQLVQVTYLFVLVIAAYGCVAVARYWPQRNVAWRRMFVAGLLCAAWAALVLGLPQLLLSWATLSLSNRTELALSAADAGSLDLHAALMLFHPNAFAGLSDFDSASFDAMGSFLYIGVIPLLSLWGLSRAWRSGEYRRSITCFGLLALLSTLYMVGTNMPLYGWLYTWMPGLVHFRRPSDAAYVMNFALAFLAGLGASRIDLRSRREVIVLLAIAATWLCLVAISMHDKYGRPFLAVIVAMVALWFLRRQASQWQTVLWLAVVLFADYRSFGFNGTFNSAGNGAARFVANPASQFLKHALAGSHGGPAERMATQNTHVPWDNTGMLLGISSTQGYNPLRYALYEAWYSPRESSAVPTVTSPYNALPENRLDDLLGVRYLVIGHRADLAPVSPPPDYVPAGRFRDVDIWRNERAYPRILNPRALRLLNVGEKPAPDEFARTNFAQTMWITPRDEEDATQVSGIAQTCRGVVTVRDISSTHTRMQLTSSATSPGWLALGELDHPGWLAELDDTPLPIHRANGMFRAVCLPAGEHRVVFRFSPWHLLMHAWRNRNDRHQASPA
ncbi:YfhO family protein [Luteibacter anthropi]|uniref:YfhO family protein n=1 Tax=Luteibacter anthropi TaxID=564369 RepID=UPI0020321CCC|nr:YfhO family protein [Luteibacter anthropi]URX63540.1 YfhO family protein [Luteibacter anthropi]